jgi:hypothetical protein
MRDDSTGRAGSVAPDGGFESEAAVRDRLAEGYVFELTYESDGEEQIRLVTHEGFDRPAAKPLEGPPAFRFASVGGDQTITLRLPEVVSLYAASVTDLAGPLREDLVRSMTEDVSSDPESVPLDDVEETLRLAVEEDVDAHLAQHLAWRTFQNRAHREAFEVLAEPLFPLLHQSNSVPGEMLFRELESYTASNPGAVEPYVPELRSLLTETAYEAGPASCLATLAEDDPGAILDTVPALATVAASDDDRARKWAIYAFSKLAGEYPEELFPALDVLVGAIDDDDENIRTNALSALGQVTGLYPDAATAVIDDLVGLIDSENPTVRGNAIGLLADIAQEHPEPVIDHAAAIARRLTDESADVRQNAAMTLIRAGGADPAAVEAQHEYLTAALDDSDPAVRANACTLIGNAHAPVSTDRLRELRDEDPDERVREQAAWALDRLS